MRACIIKSRPSAASVTHVAAVRTFGCECSEFGTVLLRYWMASRKVRIFRPSGRSIGASNSLAQPRSLMAPAVLVEHGFKALRHWQAMARLVAIHQDDFCVLRVFGI
jgi:hypothetical protein